MKSAEFVLIYNVCIISELAIGFPEHLVVLTYCFLVFFVVFNSA